MKLSKNFDLDEFTVSQTAARLNIDNEPGEEEIKNLQTLCTMLLQPIRDHFDKPLVISSGFRCEKLNALIGGAPHSQHVKGRAVDFTIPGLDLEFVYREIKDDFMYDQLIYEFGKWIHISFSVDHNRLQPLIATNEGGKVHYQPYNQA